MVTPSDQGKLAAARAAAGRVAPNSLIALGTGSTSSLAIIALSERFPRGGGGLWAVASSRVSEELARRHGLRVRPPDEGDQYDVMIDGADEVTPALDLTKGGGGALLREKLLARHARELVIAVDSTKLVDHLGQRSPIPLEIVPFARPLLLKHLRARGLGPALRTAPDGSPWLTENGNEILDLRPTGPWEPRALDAELHALTGIVETGLFLGMADRVLIGQPDGRVEERTSTRPRAGSPNP